MSGEVELTEAERLFAEAVARVEKRRHDMQLARQAMLLDALGMRPDTDAHREESR